VNLEATLTVKVRRLESDDDRETFRSGNIDLDRFFVRYAGQNQFRHHIGTTYVAVDTTDVITGFATVTASEISVRALPSSTRKQLPRYPIPVLRLARLAVDRRFQGKGVGSLLLRSVLALARQMSDEIGCVGVLVDAKPEAVSYYERLGFFALEGLVGQLGDRPEPLPMFLEIGAIPGR
jgi:GNAT superfamily N-acetyltransferase